MHSASFDGSFAGWREVARSLIQQGVPPHQITWLTDGDSGGLFDHAPVPNNAPATMPPLRIPKQLLELLQSAARFRVEDRWSLLYRILWRVAQGDRAAMLPGDIDGSRLHKRLKAIRREAHHLHAFLRFHPRPENAEGPQLVAWHEPAHDILASASGHFAERLGRTTWLIATPDDGMYWDGQRLHYQRPCPSEWQRLAQAPEDEGEALWLAYYGSTFNPARLNRSALETSMPVRFWKNLPEGPLIPQLMSQARAGAQRDGQAEAVARQGGKRIRHTGAQVPDVSGSGDPALRR
ncbi:TIGR03915 family putative DNA repair protein [Pseudomonas sp. 32.2.56]|uniref:TIGR03915 family putative DNA repair protein n=1 Tax=Pseudomonas sp. 32.2.56 TaxID=2969303 RepID=UPI0021503600|nr:TIGR03915 family putative DNA repair protein [Pseudomonas sp. 32.2.56]MCR4508266.1 TIGR03915 family putative DNA repair protein [Pseudomonas sp. 32.2.56]